jgi:hypothetical protein
MQVCIAITSEGHQCTRYNGWADRCLQHHRMRARNGPNFTDRMELKNIQNLEMNRSYIQFHGQLEAVETHAIRLALFDAHLAIIDEMVNNHGRVYDALVRRQEADILRTGFDPDAEAFANRRPRRPRIRPQQQPVAVVPPPPQEHRALNNFAADPQNVHTTEAVRQTNEIVSKILEIHVPLEYRWNTIEVSQTMGEIIGICKLTPRATWQMAAKYCSDDNIYELGKGIYGRVLDSVWQFIKTSPHRDDLTKILRDEMIDNVGMCAQGNLSRLCNILVGYMDGVVIRPSLSEILGTEFSKLMEIDDSYLRIERGRVILANNNVPAVEWNVWLDPLVD